MFSTHPTLAQVMESDAAPREPGDLQFTDETGFNPEPETVSTKAAGESCVRHVLPNLNNNPQPHPYLEYVPSPQTLPDLTKLMDTVHGQMLSISKVQKQVQDSEAGKLPPPKAEFLCLR